jgi:hypothetical protein
MKRSAKKLTLHRETLRVLEENRLEHAHGASGVDTCHNSCDSTPRSGCDGCVSNFPC